MRQLDAGKYHIQSANFDIALPVDIATDAGTVRTMLDKKGITLSSKTQPVMDSPTFYLERVVYE